MELLPSAPLPLAFQLLQQPWNDLGWKRVEESLRSRGGTQGPSSHPQPWDQMGTEDPSSPTVVLGRESKLLC